MGIALIKIKLMPESPDADLKEIEKQANSIIAKGKGSKISFNIEPIAFGLKALIAGFAIDESTELEPIETALRAIKKISSAEVVDMRRAFG